MRSLPSVDGSKLGIIDDESSCDAIGASVTDTTVGVFEVVVGDDVCSPTAGELVDGEMEGVEVGASVKFWLSTSVVGVFNDVVVVCSDVTGLAVSIVVGVAVNAVGSDSTGLEVGVEVSAKKDPVTWIPKLVHSGGNVVAGHCTKTRPGQDLSCTAGHENEFGGGIPTGQDGGDGTVSLGGKSCQFASSVIVTAAY